MLNFVCLANVLQTLQSEMTKFFPSFKEYLSCIGSKLFQKKTDMHILQDTTVTYSILSTFLFKT